MVSIQHRVNHHRPQNGLGLGAQMQQPLAVAVIGGFVAALPLLLFVFPSFIRLGYRNTLKQKRYDSENVLINPSNKRNCKGFSIPLRPGHSCTLVTRMLI
jgi:hypothetical protein